MVLRPIFDSDPDPAPHFVPAWTAVEAQQKRKADAWWLITQPDHAALSGEIALHFSRDDFAKVDPQIVRAISMHDAGWELFESDPKKLPSLHPDGRPVSFFEVQPQTFLRAWTASVDRAEEESAIGGYMVSQHFAWLGEYRLRRAEDPLGVQEQIVTFLSREQRRQSELKRSSADTAGWDSLLPLLQFCDLFSLYLCSGARQPVEFPQEFATGRVRARFEHGVCVLSPTTFPGDVNVPFRARRYPRTSIHEDSTWISVTVR
jgi:hypothetical protein